MSMIKFLLHNQNDQTQLKCNLGVFCTVETHGLDHTCSEGSTGTAATGLL